MKIRLESKIETDKSNTLSGHIHAKGWTAPIWCSTEFSRMRITLRTDGQPLGNELTEVSRKLEWAPDKLRELQEKKETRL